MSGTATHAPASRRAVAFVSLVAVAVAAALAGAAIDRAYVRTSTNRIVGDTSFHPLSSALRSPSPADRQQFLTEMTQTLELTPAQEHLIDSITASRSGQFESLRAEIRPRVDTLLSNLRSDVETVLTPAQRETYRRMRTAPPTNPPSTP